jgi:hypothetical protein
MKWAQTKDRLDRDGVNNHSERSTFFKEYLTKDELEKDLMDTNKFVEWANFDTFPLRRKAQRKYEIFCGGFLHYHDFEFKKYDEGAGYTVENGVVKSKTYPKKVTLLDGQEIESKNFEHIIYVRWLREDGNEYQDDEDNKQYEEKKRDLNHKVIIFITPTPGALNVNPPPPPPPPPPESNV